jgi:hypothetical protein
MRRSYSKIRHIQESNKILESRTLRQKGFLFETQTGATQQVTGVTTGATNYLTGSTKNKYDIKSGMNESVIITENVVINGATFIVNSDGTVSVNVDKKTSKIRFSAFYMDINVKTISKTSNGGCTVTSKNGVQKNLTKGNIDSVINFVKSNKSEDSIGGVDMEKV